jgi:hypothetical protein
MVKRLLETALTDEFLRVVLREAVERYRNELLDDEERQLLLDCIKRLLRELNVLSHTVGCRTSFRLKERKWNLTRTPGSSERSRA